MDILGLHRRVAARLTAVVLIVAGTAVALSAETLPRWRVQLSGPVRDSDHNVAKGVVSYKDLKTRNVVMQQRDYSCGAAALATLLRYYWGEDVEEIDVINVIEAMLTADELRDRVENGLTIADLRRTAVKLGFQAAIGTMTVEKLLESKVPVVVAIEQEKYNHFVVIRKIIDGYVYLADPIRGNVRITLADFSQQWIKNTLLVVVRPGQTESNVSQLGIYPGEYDPSGLNRQWIRTRVEKVLATW